MRYCFFSCIAGKKEKAFSAIQDGTKCLQNAKDADSFVNNETFRLSYTESTLKNITNEEIVSISFPLGKRLLKINTVFELDGLQLYLTGKLNKGRSISLTLATAFLAESKYANYIRLVEKFNEKLKNNPNLVYDENHSLLNPTGNLALYDYYIERLSTPPFNKRPSSPLLTIQKGRQAFL